MKRQRMSLKDLSEADRQAIGQRSPGRSSRRADPRAPATTSKHRNIKTEIDGIVFDSKLEATRYADLKLMEKAGSISNLELQKPFEIVINEQRICKYVADFVYNDANGDQVVEDAKGQLTPVYRLKKKLMLAVLGIEIVEVYAGKK